MLLKFNFKNYKSFRDEVSLDLTATKISEHSDSNFTVGNIKVLPIAGILGANASGKTNVMEAFRFMIDYVMLSLNFAGGQINPSIQNRVIKPIPYLFDRKSQNEGSKFEIYFVLDNDESEKIYQYGFIFKNSIIEEEWLNYKAKTSRDDFKTIFYRNNNDYEFNGLDKEIVKNIKVSMQKETLILTLGATLNEQLLKSIFTWFRKIRILDFGNTAENYMISQWINNSKTILDKKNQEAIVKFLAAFDDQIVGMDANEKVIDPITKQKIIEINFHHRLNDVDGRMHLPMQFESAGTQKMIHLFLFFDFILKNGSIIFIDELNSKLHPLLLRTILQLFLNKDINKKHAQIIFTSHDVWQLKSNIMRRDEIWFTEKDDKGISNLYSLSDFVDDEGEKIRKDEDYQKNYLLGKYGAIPKLKGFEGVFE